MSRRTAAGGPDEALLTVEDLRTEFHTDKERIRAVDGAGFSVGRGETVGIVGESGSGKSVTARSIMGLVDAPGRVLDGSSIRYTHPETVASFAGRHPGATVEAPDGETAVDGEAVADGEEFVVVRDRYEGPDGTELADGYVDLARAPDDAVAGVRGGDVMMVFQDPINALNPVYTVGNQIKEALRIHRGLRGGAATDEAVSLLESVGIPDAHRRVDEYPHQFSGGMRQRAFIAMALACDPELLICDEPTTALDVTIQAQILELLDELQAERGMSMLFITHDMGVIEEVADRVNVMYAGEVVESAPVDELFERPKHPYTRGLLASIPGRTDHGDRLPTIDGEVPTPNGPATQCRFAPRCDEAFDACRGVPPQRVDVGEGDAAHTAACLLYPEDEPEPRRVERHESIAREKRND